VKIEIIDNGDIFDGLSCRAIWGDVLVSPVNCKGVSGAGLAKEIAKRFPYADNLYKEDCQKRKLKPGGVIKHTGSLFPSISIFYAATKYHWAYGSRMEWVSDCTHNIAHLACVEAHHRSKYHGAPSGHPMVVRVPALGCGLGGLNWEDMYLRHGVKSEMVGILSTKQEFQNSVPIVFKIYGPNRRS
jgi:hypothetical protein